jgi:hypothetical protein
MEDILLASSLGNRVTHFIVSGKPPPRTTLPCYTPTVDLMATVATNSLNYHLNTAKGHSGLHALHSFLTATGIDATGFPTHAALTTDGPDGVGAIAMGNEAATFPETLKIVLSLTSPLYLLYATTLQKMSIHMIPDPINPRLLRICRVLPPTPEEVEDLPPEPIPHTQAAVIRTDIATGLVAAATWSCSGLPLP